MSRTFIVPIAHIKRNYKLKNLESKDAITEKGSIELANIEATSPISSSLRISIKPKEHNCLHLEKQSHSILCYASNSKVLTWSTSLPFMVLRTLLFLTPAREVRRSSSNHKP
ncbi:Os03g0339150 [Oryza sativa Japonica Group]|uniref:Os03g0339150 protein n=1 Tax=Oryza sativa subsp. japonica TaxID=39947 RepID=A0A0P0VY34_ORYSJ|nr:hypothetical protein EE612_017299 [Oryza sativa]BAS84108.1 Os03g0339150 [Oryza sativa Japonica Group]